MDSTMVVHDTYARFRAIDPVADQDVRLGRELGRLIRAARMAAGFKAYELAEMCGISPSVMSRVEMGLRPPRFTLLMTISAQLGIRLSDLVRTAEEAIQISVPLANKRFTDILNGVVDEEELNDLSSRD